jgi:hypothetical protein
MATKQLTVRADTVSGGEQEHVSRDDLLAVDLGGDPIAPYLHALR